MEAHRPCELTVPVRLPVLTRLTVTMLGKFLTLTALAALALGRRTCKVPAIGGGEDDGPAINTAFKRCATKSKIVLDKYYVVDTLLMAENLNDVEIELSGTSEQLRRLYVYKLTLAYQSNIRLTLRNGRLRVCTLPTKTRRLPQL